MVVLIAVAVIRGWQTLKVDGRTVGKDARGRDVPFGVHAETHTLREQQRKRHK